MTRVLLGRLLLRPQTPLAPSFRRNAFFHIGAPMRAGDHLKKPTNKRKETNKPAKNDHGHGRLLSRSLIEQDDNVIPSLRVNDVARKYNLGFPNDLKRLGVNQPDNKAKVQIFYNSRHLIDRNDLKYLDKSEHPYAGSVLERYVEWSDGSRPLWWSVNSFGEASPFVCTTAQRLLNRGIRLGLQSHGFDRFGRRLGERGQTQPLNNSSDLFGTLRILCSQPKDLCQLKFKHIEFTGHAIVAELVKQLQSAKDEQIPNASRQSSKRWNIAASVGNASSDGRRDTLESRLATSQQALESSHERTGLENGTSRTKNTINNRNRRARDAGHTESRTSPARSGQVAEPDNTSIVRKMAGLRGKGPQELQANKVLRKPLKDKIHDGLRK